MRETINVIIPVLDEEQRIGDQLTRLLEQHDVQEILVVDGGSADRTCEEVARFDRVRLLRSPAGRGRQMNRGAAAASGEILLFLHADVVLPPDATAHIREALARPGTVAGAFTTWTVSDSGRTWVEPWLHLADFRSRYTSLPYGDQAIFIRRLDFFRAGRYRDDLPLFEDLDFSQRVNRMGRIATIPSSVQVSGRRFIARPIYYLFLVNALPLLYKVGFTANTLSRLYGRHR
ncbi:MAG: glycosyltransferase [Myxococcales bacterium]|nr:glycosyltransferase [Myxococcales bacterium]